MKIWYATEKSDWGWYLGGAQFLVKSEACSAYKGGVYKKAWTHSGVTCYELGIMMALWFQHWMARSYIRNAKFDIHLTSMMHTTDIFIQA